jgi:hypothetical protein
MTHKVAHPELLAEIEAACARVGMSVTEFGRMALNDAAYVNNLRLGRECKMATIAKVRDAIRLLKRRKAA